MTKIVACIADLNKMGFIMQYGLLKNSHGENEECLNIDSIDIDFLEEEIKWIIYFLVTHIYIYD